MGLPWVVDRARRVQLLARARLTALLLAPAALFLLADLGHRSQRVLALTGGQASGYVAAALGSVVIWATLLYGASARSGWGRWSSVLLFGTLLTFCLGGQRYFFEQYNTYLNANVWAFATNFLGSVFDQLAADWGNYLAVQASACCVAGLLLWGARRWVQPRRTPSRVAQVIAPLVLVVAFFAPVREPHVQAAPPDVLCFTAIGGLISNELGLAEPSSRPLPRLRASLPVPPLRGAPQPQRNVVLIILESVRADAACIEYDPACRKTSASNQLTPHRYPLTQLRALSSSTAISLGVLWAGISPHESHEVFHTWPLLFDYARASGWDTAFWTSQHMTFGYSRLWVKNLAVSKQVSAADLDPDSEIDLGADEGLLVERVASDVAQLREPFFAVIQLSNVHYPYLVDRYRPQPFQPASRSKAPEDTAEFFNHYQNAVYQQDLHVADMIGALRSLPLGERTVIVYTSDHGEAFREHDQMGHTLSVLDEEVRVPGWIDAPPGVLTEEQSQNLLGKRSVYTFHVDLTATILDLMGVLDEPGIARYREKLSGVSLLRPPNNDNALPLTNCAGVWSCAFKNWGYMRRNLKLEAREWDAAWHCYDLDLDPREHYDLGEQACGDLAPLALRTFGHLPSRMP